MFYQQVQKHALLN